MKSAAKIHERWAKKGAVHSKWRQQNTKGSQTPGKKKTEECQADEKKRFFAKRARAYKYPGYAEWCAKMDIINNMKR